MSLATKEKKCARGYSVLRSQWECHYFLMLLDEKVSTGARGKQEMHDSREKDRGKIFLYLVIDKQRE